LSPFRRLRRRLVNGYTNWRYATKARPASPLGVAAAFAAPALKRVIDRQYRHLPRRPEGGGRVLDVGCGDGGFLLLARSCGWAVVGVDPDAQAASHDLDFEIGAGGIEYLDGESELFDAITLNHVIEHVYDPLNVLRRCYGLLKKGGQLWLETPNIESLGHAKFKSHWRGLEPPRHLVLFNARSLQFALTQAGFRESRRQTRPDPTLGMFRHSWAIEKGISSSANAAPPKALRLAALWAAVRAALFPRMKEFLVLAAKK